MKSRAIVFAFIVGLMTVFCSSNSDASPFRSGEPLFAKIRLDENRVLSIVFDESKGPGRGYDILYADKNFNGGYEENEVFSSAHKESQNSYAIYFDPISIIPKKDVESDSFQNSYMFHFFYNADDLIIKSVVNTSGTFLIIKDNKKLAYRIGSEIKTSKDEKKAPVIEFGGEIKPKVSIQQEYGLTGINVSLKMGDWDLTPMDINTPVTLTIKDAEGRIVHEDKTKMGSFGFG